MQTPQLQWAKLGMGGGRFKIERFRKISTLGFYKYFVTHYPKTESIAALILRYKKSKGYETDIQLLLLKKVSILDGWFQDFRWLRFIQMDFIQANENLKKSSQYLEIENQLNDSTLGVHVRRGDFLQHLDYFGVLSMKFYEEALKSLDLTRFDRILIFSDDPVWCSKQKWEGLTVNIIGPNELSSIQETHSLMGKCATLICSNSTFSLTSAYLWEVPEVLVPEVMYFDSNIRETLTSSYPKTWKLIRSEFERNEK